MDAKENERKSMQNLPSMDRLGKTRRGNFSTLVGDRLEVPKPGHSVEGVK